MLAFSLLATAAAALLPVLTSAVSPGACTGACWTHDPSVIKAPDGTYYRYSTGNKILIMSASSISGPWTQLGSALPSGSSISLTGSQDLWAPDVTLIDGVYYLIYTVSSFGSQASALGVATSNGGNLGVGGWTDHGSTGIESKSGDNYNAIDGNLVVDGSKTYMAFGSFWSDLYATPMASPPLTTAGGSQTNIAFNSTGTQALEGPFIFPKSGNFYLFFSSGSCCGLDKNRPKQGEEYKIMVCRSSSATGPFTDAEGKNCLTGNGGTLVLGSHGTLYAPGGQGVIADDDGDKLYYHYVDTEIGYADGDKLFGWNVLEWGTGWPVAV